MEPRHPIDPKLGVLIDQRPEWIGVAGDLFALQKDTLATVRIALGRYLTSCHKHRKTGLSGRVTSRMDGCGW
jgi:hypothetical protein